MADFLEDAKGVKDAHDKFFKMVFSNELDTRTFIDKFFPKDIREHIDLDSVKLIDNEKLTKGYKKYQLDLSFDCKFKEKESKFYLIFEHKSALDKFVLLQILSYMTVTWETNLKQNKDLIPIIPVIFYQGKEKWNIPEEFSDQFKSIKSDKDLSFLFEYLPKFKHILFDTKNLSNSMIEEGLRENISLFFKLAALKYYKDSFEELKKIFALVYHIIKEQGLDLL
ncbi:Rpn family recombination-promoting nuclease/putative transposase, partial [Thermodesulfobium sp. 4217-1]|uniref:Rpn family recombination-promoting nuclease/putative transposase n=1 Tax=Thermodesulfobium sp. 4217-1 TaxID=3120013 RepID=UPI003221CA4B